ncbi:MFS transporter, partial [Streptomyces sp900116325]|uniref:MFS transporter n=1 Tax=Streptomyces sp. 900116325 TaxID=3154295 RepID=UPI0033DC245B
MTLVNAFGNGLFMTVNVLFFTRGLHLKVSQVGVGLTLAALCGVLASVPAGRAADRWGSKRVLMVLVVAEAVGMASYYLVHSYAAFAVLACAVTAVDRGSNAVRNTLYAQALPKDTRVAGRAYLRAVTNVAMGAGASLAALALQADTRQAYLAAILTDAATFVAVAVMLPPIRVAPPSIGGSSPAAVGTRPRSALRDFPFLVVTLISSLLAVQFAVIEIGVPLWLVQSTHAPRVL